MGSHKKNLMAIKEKKCYFFPDGGGASAATNFEGRGVRTCTVIKKKKKKKSDFPRFKI